MHFIHHQYSYGGGSDRNLIETRAQLEIFGPKHAARVIFSAHHANLRYSIWVWLVPMLVLVWPGYVMEVWGLHGPCSITLIPGVTRQRIRVFDKSRFENDL